MYATVNQSDRDNLDFACHSPQEFSSCFLSAQIRYVLIIIKAKLKWRSDKGKSHRKKKKK
jgi:hypothetical protein